eukprot:1851895-Rhodomonas_salina.1
MQVDASMVPQHHRSSGNCWPSKNCITIYKSLYWGQLEFLLTKKLHPGNLVEIYCILYGNPLDNRSGTFGKCHAVGTGNVQCRSEVVAGPTVTPTRSECQHGPRLAFARRTNSHNFVTSTSCLKLKILCTLENKKFVSRYESPTEDGPMRRPPRET